MWAPHTCPVTAATAGDCCLRAIARSTDPPLTADTQAERPESYVARRRGIRQQHHVADTQFPQNLRADADFDAAAFRIAVFAFLAFGILRDRARHAFRPQVANEDDDAPAFAGDLLHRLLDQCAARA